MLNKSLFICYSTPNYSKLTDICLDSLKSINVQNIHHMLDTSHPSKTSGFQTDLWYYCVRNKIKHLINVLTDTCDSLTNNKYFIFTDCDIVYIKKNIDEWFNLEQFIINKNNDIFFMRENTSNDVNSGFFIIKNNDNIKNIINFFIEVLENFDKTDKKNMPFGDQSIINNLKNKINYSFIPNDYVIFGTTIYNKNKSLFHHAVCCRDVYTKIVQINEIKKNFIYDLI
jgi:hypothetical protein